jgi:metallophosphoesterase superfamily enzyme
LRLAGVDGLAFAHHPEPLAGAYVIAGHVHPAVRLGGAIDSLRLPCFHFGAAVGVLPAFGAFTGMHVVRPAPGERVFVVAGDSVRPLPLAVPGAAG